MEAVLEQHLSDLHLTDPFLDRVRRGYKIALDLSNDHHGRMWREIDQRRAPVHNALLADTNNDLRRTFANPAASELFNGVDYLRRNVLDTTLPPDSIIAGARLGNRTLKQHLKECAKRLFVQLPKSLQDAPPPFPNPFPDEVGLQTSTGTASYRAVQAVYQALLIQSALIPCTKKSVVEIGPGMGRTAFYAYHMGITEYTTVDLPLGIVAQACFLGATLGPDKIWVYGDDETTAAGRIRLIVAGQKPDKMYGVAFNSDSMTEMSLPAAMDYMTWLHKHCQALVSINMNKNLFTVSDISRKYFTLASWRACPMEPGYAEEIFRPRQSSGLTAWHRILWHITKLFIKRGPKRAIYSLYDRAKGRLRRVGPGEAGG